METFGIDPKELSHAVQVGVACSAAITPLQQKNKGVQIIIQGNQINFIADLLLSKYLFYSVNKNCHVTNIHFYHASHLMSVSLHVICFISMLAHFDLLQAMLCV